MYVLCFVVWFGVLENYMSLKCWTNNRSNINRCTTSTVEPWDCCKNMCDASLSLASWLDCWGQVWSRPNVWHALVSRAAQTAMKRVAERFRCSVVKKF